MMEPWFLGLDGPGMSLDAAKAALGAKLSLTPGRNARALQPLVPPARSAVAAIKALLDATVTDGKRPGLGLYLGAKGAALVVGPSGRQQAYPVATWNPRGFVLLSEADSRAMVAGASSQAFSRLDGGLAPSQTAPPPPTTDAGAGHGLLLGLAALGVAVAGGGAYFLTR